MLAFVFFAPVVIFCSHRHLLFIHSLVFGSDLIFSFACCWFGLGMLRWWWRCVGWWNGMEGWCCADCADWLGALGWHGVAWYMGVAWERRMDISRLMTWHGMPVDTLRYLASDGRPTLLTRLNAILLV
ncbi:uncharacterized protein K452DRAFT_67356 [Aplosporella prunicola CBS 121167]|uniref:Uncharacterized protein n=1 Tax=Aplosporella prunicola CBS 121167 TaxID=1176127 RepID=A0A6A6BR10_9PEZI|nr:uncharacterized protein K452DRAFT_67356 [Aplosporella prunicola CBS 121167]KAF2146552.1 hypothetical protein K452DRAFT_67356 [Aplosporella prunicola CBS 121167]